MNRTGVITFGCLTGGHEPPVQHYLLLYSELWVPWLKESYPTEEEITEWDLDRSELAAIAYLEQEGLVKAPPIELNLKTIARDEVTKGLLALYKHAQVRGNKTYPTAKQAAREGAASIWNTDIALSRLTSYLWWRERGELVYPVAFPFGELEGLPKQLTETHNVLSIVLKRLPMPSATLPLEDIVAFKKDTDTQYKFARFWQWTQKMAKGSMPKHELQDEIDWLVTDYSHHLQQLSMTRESDSIEVLVATPFEIVEDLAKFRWGQLARRLFAVRRKRIAAHAAELKLPGSDLAYITKASSLLARRYGQE